MSEMQSPSSDRSSTTQRKTMPSINLMTLANDAQVSLGKLTSLAGLSSAPLRVEHRNGQIHLGVRSWSTYFFEKIVASDLELAQIETRTQIAIEKHVRAFLNSPDMSAEAGKEKLIMDLLHARTLNQTTTKPEFSSSKKQPAAKSEKEKNEKIELRKVTSKPFNEAILVQRGVTIAQPSALEQASPELKDKAEWIMGVVDAIFNPLCDKNLRICIRKTVEAAIKPSIKNSTLHVIADVRLVRKETMRSATIDLLDRGNVVELDYTDEFKNLRTKDAFQDYYHKHLKSVSKFVKSTMLLELPYDSEPVCTNANVFGATDAAHAFIETQRQLGKTISVMIVVPRLPDRQPKSGKGRLPDGASEGVRQPETFGTAPTSDTGNMLDANV